MTHSKLLRIYLNDHLAISRATFELAKRCLSNNKGTELGNYLETLVAEVASDRSALERAMDLLAIPPARLKGAAAWAAEKAGRLKMNGRISGYSDLSRLLELEALHVGIEWKLVLWRNLKALTQDDERLGSLAFDDLVRRAERQKSGLEAHRHQAVETAFAL